MPSIRPMIPTTLPLVSTPSEGAHPAPGSGRYELRFRSLFHEGRALAFECDARGVVDLDALGERARANYFLARTSVGRDYASPLVVARAELRS